MTTIALNIDDRFLAQLRAKAQDESKSVEQVALDLLETYAPNEVTQETDFLLAFVHMAEAEDWSSATGDISERSREILETEFPECLEHGA